MVCLKTVRLTQGLDVLSPKPKFGVEVVSNRTNTLETVFIGETPSQRRIHFTLVMIDVIIDTSNLLVYKCRTHRVPSGSQSQSVRIIYFDT